MCKGMVLPSMCKLKLNALGNLGAYGTGSWALLTDWPSGTQNGNKTDGQSSVFHFLCQIFLSDDLVKWQG